MNSHYDVAIIGGGIHGAGIAQAAAAAGYSVILIEKQAWAAGTSSKSSKLIHGGLRYLKQLQLGLVRESLIERNILLRIAPHLVRLNTFYIPIYKETKIRPWSLRIGMSLYAMLGGLGKEHRFHTLPKSAWNQLDGIKLDHLQTVFSYSDAQTDDALLTHAVVESARQLGATLACPANFLGAQLTEPGYEILIESQGKERSIGANILINASGPWLPQVASKVAPPPPSSPIELVQGSHLVLNRPLSERCYYLESPHDGRAIFALPWRGKTLLGTTETVFKGDPDNVHILEAEEQYLLDILGYYFPDYSKDIEVCERMAGLRVLPATTKTAFSRSREVIIDQHLHAGGGYIGLSGGKLTGYRATAEKVCGQIQSILGRRPAIADTATLKLPQLAEGA